MEVTLGTDDERAELISICEAASVPQNHWYDRDSEGAQRQVGECLMLLRAGCDFCIHTKANHPRSQKKGEPPFTNSKTIWITVWSEGFAFHDWGGDRNDHLFYLPTRKRLAAVEGTDWY